MERSGYISRLLIGAAMLFAVLVLVLGLFMRPVRQIVMVWLAVDFGLIVAWMAGSIAYVMFRKQDTTVKCKFLKVDFSKPETEIPCGKLAAKIAPPPSSEPQITIKHG